MTVPTLGVGALAAAYIALAAVVLGLNLHSAWHWSVKAASTLGIAALCWVTWSSWPTLLGWPTERDVPARFYLHAATVDEPYRIYLWGTDLAHGLGRTVPRAFALPYDKVLHERVDKATRKLRKGLPVIGRAVPANVAPERTDSLESTDAVSDITFVDAPQSLVPGKP